MPVESQPEAFREKMPIVAEVGPVKSGHARSMLAIVLCAAALSGCGAGAIEAERPPAAGQPEAQAPADAALPRPVFDSGRAWDLLQKQVAIGPRPAGSPALDAGRRLIIGELKAAGIAAREQVFDGDTPAGRIRMVNLVATIPGRRPERIALATHYDTKAFRDIRFVGASDGASSTAAVLELGRALSGRRNEFTIELLFLDGEEAVVEWTGNDHTYGSRHYVADAQRNGTLTSLKALVLLDMIGDRNLDIRREANSTPWLVDIIWSAAARLGHRATFVDELTTVEDDHIPFIRAGVPSVDIIDLNYPEWHTAGDTIERVSARSLQIVGDVVLAAWPDIEQRLAASR
jgi:glutaminyl-peptide cyclotransferase